MNGPINGRISQWTGFAQFITAISVMAIGFGGLWIKQDAGEEMMLEARRYARARQLAVETIVYNQQVIIRNQAKLMKRLGIQNVEKARPAPRDD